VKNKPVEVQNLNGKKERKLIRIRSRNECPESAGITVRFAQESLSDLRKNHCPEWSGIGVRFTQEYALKNKLLLHWWIRSS